MRMAFEYWGTYEGWWKSIPEYWNAPTAAIVVDVPKSQPQRTFSEDINRALAAYGWYFSLLPLTGSIAAYDIHRSPSGQ